MAPPSASAPPRRPPASHRLWIMITPTAPRYAGLDGLRAVAVLIVVLYHLFPALSLIHI